MIASGAPHDPNLAAKIAAVRERRATFEAHRRTLVASGQDQISLTDLDARERRCGKGEGAGLVGWPRCPDGGEHRLAAVPRR